MAVFISELAVYLRTKLPLATVYTHTGPAPESEDDYFIIISPQSTIDRFNNQQLHERIYTFLISGNSDTCLSRAKELWDVFYPGNRQGDTSFKTDSHIVNAVFTVTEPRLSANDESNRFWALLRLRFLAVGENG